MLEHRLEDNLASTSFNQIPSRHPSLRRNFTSTDTRVMENDATRSEVQLSISSPPQLISQIQSRKASVFRASSRRLSITVPPDEIFTHIPPCPKCCKHCLRDTHPLPDKPTKWDHIKQFFLCPPRKYSHKVLLAIIMALMVLGILWGIVEEEAIPQGVIFFLWLIEVAGFVGGILFSLVGLPPLLGMLSVGIFIGNFPVDIFKVKDKETLAFWFSTIRGVALGIILTRAGLGLNPTALLRLKFVCFRLAFIPCLVECGTATIVAHFLLDFPWLWSCMLGFALAAVSPAVVVPGMLNVQRKKLSVLKGLPTLLIASSSIDDVLAIGGFGIVMSITFSTGNLIMTILHGPIEICVGIAYGICMGLILWYIPDPLLGRDLLILRISTLLIATMFSMFFFRGFEYAGAGALGTIVVAFVSGYSWREDYRSSGLREISFHFARIWLLIQPLMFGLVGSEMLFSQMELNTIGLGVATILICLLTRGFAAATVVFGCGFNFKEHIFIALAWIPKATVQAAVGPVPLDYVRTHLGNAELEDLALKLLQIVTLAILICAPLGAIGIALTARCLLTKDPSEVDLMPEERPSTTHIVSLEKELPLSESEVNMFRGMLVKTEEHHSAVKIPTPVPETPLPPETPSQEYMEFLQEMHIP